MLILVHHLFPDLPVHGGRNRLSLRLPEGERLLSHSARSSGNRMLRIQVDIFKGTKIFQTESWIETIVTSKNDFDFSSARLKHNLLPT